MLKTLLFSCILLVTFYSRTYANELSNRVALQQFSNSVVKQNYRQPAEEDAGNTTHSDDEGEGSDGEHGDDNPGDGDGGSTTGEETVREELSEEGVEVSEMEEEVEAVRSAESSFASLEEFQARVTEIRRELHTMQQTDSDLSNLDTLAEEVDELLESLDEVPGVGEVAGALTALLTAIQGGITTLQGATRPAAEAASEVTPLLDRIDHVVEEGTEIYHKAMLIIEVASLLSAGGILAIELSDSKKDEAMNNYPENLQNWRVVCSVPKKVNKTQFKCIIHFFKQASAILKTCHNATKEFVAVDNKLIKPVDKILKDLSPAMKSVEKVLKPVSTFEGKLKGIEQVGKKLKKKLSDDIVWTLTYPDPEFQDLTHTRSIDLRFNVKRILTDVKKEISNVIRDLGSVEREAIEKMGLSSLENKLVGMAKKHISDAVNAAKSFVKKHAPPQVKKVVDGAEKMISNLNMLQKLKSTAKNITLKAPSIPSNMHFNVDALERTCHL